MGVVIIDWWVWFATNFCFRKLEPMHWENTSCILGTTTSPRNTPSFGGQWEREQPITARHWESAEFPGRGIGFAIKERRRSAPNQSELEVALRRAN